MAATWDEELSEQYGQLASEEASSTGHNVLLSPAADIFRDPRAGRAPRGVTRAPNSAIGAPSSCRE